MRRRAGSVGGSRAFERSAYRRCCRRCWPTNSERGRRGPRQRKHPLRSPARERRAAGAAAHTPCARPGDSGRACAHRPRVGALARDGLRGIAAARPPARVCARTPRSADAICKTCARARSTADSMCTPNERRCSNTHAHVSRARSTKSTEAFVDGRDHCARSEGRICSGGEKTGRTPPEVLPLAVFCYYFCSHAPPQIHSCLNTSANDGGGPNPSPKLFATVIIIWGV